MHVLAAALQLSAIDGAHLIGSLWLADGAVTASKVSTAGFNNVSLSYDRSCMAGLGSAEGFVAEYAVNGGLYVNLETTRDTASKRVSFALPASAAAYA